MYTCIEARIIVRENDGYMMKSMMFEHFNGCKSGYGEPVWSIIYKVPLLRKIYLGVHKIMGYDIEYE